MKKTILNTHKVDINELRERLNEHFKSHDSFRNEKFSTIEEALIEGYKIALNENLDKNEKHKLLQKSYNTLVYMTHEEKYNLEIEHYLVLRNIVIGLHNTKEDNENYIFALLDISYKILLKCVNVDKEQFYFISNDTLYYLMDYLLDKRVFTSSEKEVEIFTAFFFIIERELEDEIKNIKETKQFSLITTLYLTMGAYLYINGQESYFDVRKDLICLGILSVNKEDYNSKIIASIIAAANFNRYNSYKGKELIENKIKELKEEK